MTNRLVRVCEVLKRELSLLMQKKIAMKFDAPLVSVAAVDITPDLKHAHFYITAYGNDAQKRAALITLEQNRPMLQHEVSKRVKLKNTPHFHFHLDESIERGVRVLRVMDELGLDESPKKSEEDERE